MGGYQFLSVKLVFNKTLSPFEAVFVVKKIDIFDSTLGSFPALLVLTKPDIFTEIY